MGKKQSIKTAGPRFEFEGQGRRRYDSLAALTSVSVTHFHGISVTEEARLLSTSERRFADGGRAPHQLEESPSAGFSTETTADLSNSIRTLSATLIVTVFSFTLVIIP